MKFETTKYEVTETFLTRLLGTAPADQEVYKSFIAEKRLKEADRRAKAAERLGKETVPPQGTTEEELDSIREEAGITQFHCDVGQVAEDGNPGRGIHLYDYQVGGFWKEAAENLVELHGVPQVRSKLDNFMLIEPRRVYILDENGQPLQKADMKLERPLRAKTPQGPRVSLACSEVIHPGRRIVYTVDFLPFIKTGKGREAKRADLDALVDMILAYGQRKGRGQWRNGGNGKLRATWRSVPVEAKA